MSEKRFDVQALFDVRDRTAVFTGGSSHFGRAMARALAQAGADEQSGALAPRGQAIIVHTPMDRLGALQDLLGTLLWAPGI